ncbi:hypothetical protein C1Y40_04195 [Mycobacterium talmoniae]|uniref:Uncharacterized protein n=1 Tax=Mycobacterium talmoniae TaxID=1858794 RepID=A0A2S8BG46_9MYCO|nr:hypothetical protein C1Y40_04195 [Mycobacterium talmoniae]
MVFGDPKPGEAEPVSGLCQPHRGRQRIGGGLVGPHRDEVEHRKTHVGLQRRRPGEPSRGQRTAGRRARGEETWSSMAGVSRPVNMFCWLG